MDTPPELEFDRLMRLAKRVTGADAAVLHLLDGRQLCTSAYDPDGLILPGDVVSLLQALPLEVLSREAPVAIEDVAAAPRGSDRSALYPEKIRGYLSVPVRAPGGEVVGVTCALTREPRAWTEDDVESLEDVGSAVATEIRLRADLRTRSRAEQKLRESENRFRAMFEACGLGIAVVDSSGRFQESNPALLRMLEYDVGEIEHRPVDSVVHPEDVKIDRVQLDELFRGRRDWYQVEKRFIRRSGSTIWGRLTVTAIDQPPSRDSRVLEIIEDVTASKEMEEELRQLTLTDALTGLHNRRGFVHLAEQQWKLARKKNQRLTLVYADLNGFKQINDTHGHAMGDAALVEVAKLLRSRYRETDVVARMGGDEFVVLAIEADCADETLTDRLTESIETFNRQRTLPFDVTLSLGIIRFSPTETRSLDELLDMADREMYESKRRPRKAAGAAPPAVPVPGPLQSALRLEAV